MTLDIDPSERRVEGSMTVAFTPDLATDELVLRLWPNGPRTAAEGVSSDLTRLEVNGQAVVVEFDDPTTARTKLPTQANAGETITISAAWTLTVPAELRSRLSASTDDYLRLGTIVPLLPWEPGLGWALDPPTALFAEAVSSPAADWQLTINVPAGFDVLASGVRRGDTWIVEAARDVAVTVGRFRTVEAIANAPDPVVVTVGVHDGLADEPLAYLNKVVESLEQFSARFGPYPWPALSLAITPNLRGGIEFPTHIMQGPGTLGRTTSHEVAHMWFYSLVGNNQGADPWLDEGLASYAEFTYEGTPPNAFDIPPGARGMATQSMVWLADRSDLYYRSVYAQTGFALQQLGARADVDCALARYVAANAHRIATPADLVAAFEVDFPDVIDRLGELGVVIAAP